MGREHVATRLDQPEYNEIEAITREKGISKSEAMRRVVQDGLESRGRITSVNAGQDEDDADTRTVKSGQIIPSLWALVQLAITLATLVLVAGGAL